MSEKSQLIVKNPFNGTQLGSLQFANEVRVRQALEKSSQAFQKWRFSKAFERSQLLLQVAKDLESQKEEFVKLICQEAGKPVTYARIEFDRAIGVLNWAAGEATRYAGELLRLDASSTGRPGFGIHTRFPRGIVLGITPFNFPLNLVIHKIAPAVACGCSILIKPSPATPLTALKLASLFHAYQPGLVQTLLADDDMTAALTRAKEISMISFTGSAKVGEMIRHQAADKHVVLELGGNAWVVVMEDTPQSALPRIAKRIAGASFGYAGQSCISVQNIAVVGDIWPQFKTLLSEETKNTAYGDPEDTKTISGPVINQKSADRIRSELLKAANDGDVVYASSQGPKDEGLLVSPALILLSDGDGRVDQRSYVQEEIFGPVMTARKFNDVDDLIKQINSSRYGLQAGVFTQNLEVIQKFYRELEVGGVMINDVPTTRYDHQPYGGIKDSGEGREGVRYAMDDMTYSKFLGLSSQIP